MVISCSPSSPTPKKVLQWVAYKEISVSHSSQRIFYQSSNLERMVGFAGVHERPSTPTNQSVQKNGAFCLSWHSSPYFQGIVCFYVKSGRISRTGVT